MPHFFKVVVKLDVDADVWVEADDAPAAETAALDMTLQKMKDASVIRVFPKILNSVTIVSSEEQVHTD